MKTLMIAPQTIFPLIHHAQFVDVAVSQGIIVAGATYGTISGPGKDGVFSVADMETGRLTEYYRPFGVTDVAIHPLQPLIAVVSRSNIAMLKRDGTVLWEVWVEMPEDEGDIVCCFSRNGEYLWYAKAGDEIDLRVLDAGTGQTLAKTTVEDLLGDSQLSFHPMPYPMIILWATAGQDGQEVIWLTHIDHQIKISREPLVEVPTQPVFAPSGREFLIAGVFTVFRYNYPSGTLVGECQWPWDEEEVDDAFLNAFAWPTPEQALISTEEGRLFLLDTTTMDLTAEVVVTGYEPRPAQEVYNNLVGVKSHKIVNGKRAMRLAAW